MNNMKLYPIAQQSLDELQGVSFNSAYGHLLLLHILIQLKRMVSCPHRTKKFILSKYSKSYENFPIDIFRIVTEDDPTRVGGYVLDESGYNGSNEYVVTLSFNDASTKTSVYHELHHPYEDYMRRLKNPHLKNRLRVAPAKKEYDDQGLEIFIQKGR